MNMFSLPKLLCTALLTSTLIACGGGGGGDSSTGQTTQNTTNSSTTDNTNSSPPSSGTSEPNSPTDNTTSPPPETEEPNPPPEETTEPTEEPTEETPEEEPVEEVEEEPILKSVTLSWTAPSTREDGNALDLSEINGYEIYYFMDGSAEGEGKAVTVDGATNTEITIDNLSPGTYYFAIATIDSNGLYSDTSDHVEASIQ